MALSWQLEPASTSPALNSPHASLILTSTPLPARRTFTRLTASTRCCMTTPCIPSITSVEATFPTPSPSSLEAGALHHPSPPPSLLRIRRSPLTLTTTKRNLPYNRSRPQHASPGAATLTVLSPDNSAAARKPSKDIRSSHIFLESNRIHPVLPVHHLITALRLPQPLIERPSRYE